ncbi:MAG: RNase adapter RapZ [Candidatus Kryptonium sp.]
MKLHAVIITGESGAGKSSVLKALEDLDYLAIENFPARLLLPFLEELSSIGFTDKVALVMDLRDPHFLQDGPEILSKLREHSISYDLIYLTADTEVLITRFSQTRRPHPLFKDFKDLRKAIEAEKQRLSIFKEYATIFLDTSNFNIHQLRHEIFILFGKHKDIQKPLLHIISFGYKYGIPSEVNYLFDARMLPNPYFVPELKPLSGEDQKIKDFLLQSPKTTDLLNHLVNYLKWAIPMHLEEGRKLIILGIGCTGGRHRSPAVAQFLAERISRELPQIEVVVTLRDVERD